jgi:hypothetical protein
VRRARRAALCARTGAISGHSSLAGRLGSRRRLALGRRSRRKEHSRSGQTESSRKVSHWHSHDFLLGRPRGAAASLVRFPSAEDSRSWNCSPGPAGRQLSVARDAGWATPAAEGGPCGRFHVEHRQPIISVEPRAPGSPTRRQSPHRRGGPGVRGPEVATRGRRRSRNLREGARLEARSASGLGSITLTEFTIMRRPGIERSELEASEFALARGDHSSGRLIRSGDSNCQIRHRQAHLRVIRPVIGSSGSERGRALRVARVARPCAAVVSPGLPRRADLPRSWHLVNP